MKLYTYAIIDSTGAVEESIKGLFDALVYTIPYRNIGMVVSDLDPHVQIKTEESVLKHEKVVEALMDKFTVLPMRLYTVFSKKEEVLLKAKEHYDDFIENLDRVRGKREFGIKIIWASNVIKERIINAHKNESPSAEPDQSGTKFMKEKFRNYKIDKEFEEEADRCIAIVDGFFNRYVSEKKLEKLKTDNLLLSAAYLVDKEKRGDFKKAFEELKSSGGDLKYMLSGPWPAYNFITLKHSGDGKFGGMDLVETVLQHKDPEEKDEK
ncbi:MAG: GvpL/GvpF family gas vesicle protein [Candidatus Omnitrophica bacterium]|nr:GvpL/GvpF family gas vesicle protein [Candidatus Omnitrophota bacterium]